MNTAEISRKLYQYEVCPFCWKARVGLALKGLDYSKVEVHPLNKKELAFSDDYRKVPIFVDQNESQVNDSTEILKYLNEEYTGQGVNLYPEGQETQKWLEWSEKYVKAIPPLIYKDFGDSLKAFDYITNVTKFSWVQRKLIKYSGALVMKMVAKKSKERQSIDDESEHFLSLIDQWVEGLGDKAFMGGSEPDASDAAVYGFSLSLKGLPANVLLQSKPGFKEWLGRMKAKTSLSL
jgi:microsomal prostaglandin-E synthase 2